MNRRSAAIVTAVVLLLGCGIAAGFMTVPFVRYQPGPTVDVLGRAAEGPIVEVQGHRTFPTAGQLRMTTVRTTGRDGSPTIMEALRAWVDPSQSLYPYDAIYPDEGTPEDDRTESQIEMVTSQDDAIAAALRELGYELTAHVQVRGTVPGGAAEGKLEAHDVIVAVNGTRIRTPQQVADVVSALTPGDVASFVVRRAGKRMTVRITTAPAAGDPGRAVVGIFPGLGYDFPFDVRVNVPDSIGGPSAGLIFSLAIFDTLTPGRLTGGVAVAGTGTIDEEGQVGPIGGIQQKIAGAEKAGAELFLVPPGNCAEALQADTDLKLVRADTMHAARVALRRYAKNREAELPVCPVEGSAR